jgi:hypothetical protein
VRLACRLELSRFVILGSSAHCYIHITSELAGRAIIDTDIRGLSRETFVNLRARALRNKILDDFSSASLLSTTEQAPCHSIFAP